MNFEELLETRDVRKTTKVRLPYGYFYKRLIDGKYSNFVEFHDEVADHVAFSNCVRTEAADMEKVANKHQLHFVPNEGDGGVYAIAVEVGNFITFEQLLNENPSVIAREEFANETLRDLAELTEQLNDKGVYHVCFAPNNVLARKNDLLPRRFWLVARLLPVLTCILWLSLLPGCIILQDCHSSGAELLPRQRPRTLSVDIRAFTNSIMLLSIIRICVAPLWWALRQLQ